jgi:hypothetical protein
MNFKRTNWKVQPNLNAKDGYRLTGMATEINMNRNTSNENNNKVYQQVDNGFFN